MKKLLLMFTVLLFSISIFFGFVEQYVPANMDYIMFLNPGQIFDFLGMTEEELLEGESFGLSTMQAAIYGKNAFIDIFGALDIDFDYEPENIIFPLLSNNKVIAIKSNELPIIISSFLLSISEYVENYDIHGSSISAYKIYDFDYTVYLLQRDGITFLSGNIDLLDLSLRARNNRVPKLQIPSSLDTDKVIYSYTKQLNIFGYISKLNNIFGNEIGEEISAYLSDEHIVLEIESHKEYMDFEIEFINKRDYSDLRVLKDSNFNYIFSNLSNLNIVYILDDLLEDLREPFNVFFKNGGAISINGFDIFDESEFNDIGFYFEVNRNNIEEILDFLRDDFNIQRQGNDYVIQDTDNGWNVTMKFSLTRGYGFVYLGEKTNVDWGDFVNVSIERGKALKSFWEIKDDYYGDIAVSKEYLNLNNYNNNFNVKISIEYLIDNLGQIMMLFEGGYDDWDWDDDWYWDDDDWDWDDDWSWDEWEDTVETEYLLWDLFTGINSYYYYNYELPESLYELYESGYLYSYPGEQTLYTSYYMEEDSDGNVIIYLVYWGEIEGYLTTEYLRDYIGYVDNIIEISVNRDEEIIYIIWMADTF